MASRGWVMQWKKSLIMAAKGFGVMGSPDWLGPG